MCFALPLKVKKISGKEAIVEGGKKVKIGNLKLEVGDYVLVFANLAVEKVKKRDAQYTRILVKSK